MSQTQTLSTLDDESKPVLMLLQARVQPETHEWLRTTAARRQVTIGSLVDELLVKALRPASKEVADGR